MNDFQRDIRQHKGGDSRRRGLFGGLGFHLASGLALYQGCHS